MKRHESLVPLSRDHHSGLLCCWKIRQGIGRGIAPDRIARYVDHFRTAHLQPHFKEEEQLLFIYRQDELTGQAINEHNEARALLEAISSAPSYEHLHAFADLLEKHIRFEERILFPHLEKICTGDELAAIGKHLHELHPQPATDTYGDEFWTGKEEL